MNFLLLHIVIALTSMVYTTYLMISPSTAKFRVSYALVAATLATGVYLTWVSPAHILQTCMTGLLYTGLVTTGIVFAHSRFARETQRHDR